MHQVWRHAGDEEVPAEKMFFEISTADTNYFDLETLHLGLS